MHVRSARKNCFGLVFDFRFLATSPRLLSAVPCMEAQLTTLEILAASCDAMAGGLNAAVLQYRMTPVLLYITRDISPEGVTTVSIVGC